MLGAHWGYKTHCHLSALKIVLHQTDLLGADSGLEFVGQDKCGGWRPDMAHTLMLEHPMLVHMAAGNKADLGLPHQAQQLPAGLAQHIAAGGLMRLIRGVPEQRLVQEQRHGALARRGEGQH